VCPWSFWEKVLISLDSTAKKQNVKKEKTNVKYTKEKKRNNVTLLRYCLPLLEALLFCSFVVGFQEQMV
jgi:hypothetical protein